MEKDIEWVKDRIQQKLDFYSNTDEEWQFAKVRAYAECLSLIAQMETEDKLHWYICTNSHKLKCDMSVSNDSGSYYGFRNEPDYELFQIYDLRKIGHESIDEFMVK